MKKSKKLIAFVLTITMLLTMIPAQVFAAENENAEISPELSERKSPIVAELTDERDRYMKIYLHADGTQTAFVSSEPLHYMQDDEWLDIDNTLKNTVVDGQNILTNTENEYSVELPMELNDNSEIKISSGDYNLSFAINDMQGTAEAQPETEPMLMALEEEEAPAKTQIQEFAEEELENKVSKVTYSFQLWGIITNCLARRIRRNTQSR